MSRICKICNAKKIAERKVWSQRGLWEAPRARPGVYCLNCLDPRPVEGGAQSAAWAQARFARANINTASAPPGAGYSGQCHRRLLRILLSLRAHSHTPLPHNAVISTTFSFILFPLLFFCLSFSITEMGQASAPGNNLFPGLIKT